MKKALLLILALVIQHLSFSNTYYVASSGNDSSDGLSPIQAFQTLDKLNQLVFFPGDTILFNRGDIFRGMLLMKSSGSAGASIYIGAYGTGSRPVLSGAETITGWINSQGNQYTVSCPSCPDTLQQIFINNNRHIPARYPNTGYLEMTNVSTTSFAAAGLTQPAGIWDSAAIHLRTQHWVIDEFLVKSYTTGHITYSIPSHFYTSYPIQEHFGFFLSDKYLALDTAGEWYYNKQNKEIIIVPSDPITLLSSGAEVSVYKNCIQFSNGVKYVSIKDLQMEKSLEDAIFLDGTSFINISDCYIYQSGRDGVGGFENYNTYNTSLTVQNCTIRDICNTGINLTGGQQMVLRNNTISLCGLIPGMGAGSDTGYEGIYCPSDSKITGNIIDSIGYSGIHVNSRDSVMYNSCTHFGLTKNDCGGIYFWSGSLNYVAYNYTGDGYANGQGTVYPDRTMCNGIYSDDFSHHNIIEYNTSWNNEMGMVLHKSAYTTIRNNIFYDNWKAQLHILEGSSYSPNVEVHDNFITGNVLQCLHPTQRSLRINTEKNNVQTMATFTGNRHCNPYSEDLIEITYTPGYSSANYTLRYKACTLNDWKTFYGFDQDGIGAFDFPSSYAQYILSGADLIQNSNFTIGTGWWWTYGNTDFSLVAAAANAHMTTASLRGQYNNTQTLKEGNWGTAPLALEKNKQYLLTYIMEGEKTGGFQTAINYLNAPYTRNMVPTVLNKSFDTGVKNDSVLFTAASSTGSALIFNSTSDDGNFWMDNIYLHEVNADTGLSKPHMITVLFKNAAFVPLTIQTAGKYRTLEGNLVTSDTVLQPFTSLVLKDISAKVNVTGIRRRGDVGQAISVYPNPTMDRFSIKEDLQGISAEIVIRNIQGVELYRAPYSGGEIKLPSEWTNGVYMVIIDSEKGQSVSRLVVCR